MLTMLERLSLHQAIALSPGDRITVTSLDDHSIAEYEFLAYAGCVLDVGHHRPGRHRFDMRADSGKVARLSDVDLGLSGNTAVARFADAPVRPLPR